MTETLPDAQKEALNARIPMGRMGEGADIGAAVAYLASKEAGYVTGQTLHVTAGWRCFDAIPLPAPILDIRANPENHPPKL